VASLSAENAGRTIDADARRDVPQPEGLREVAQQMAPSTMPMEDGLMATSATTRAAGTPVRPTCKRRMQAIS
jgi:hypothetical protein